MAFRKIQFKNVGATRSSQVIGEGEVAVDSVTKQLYIGNGTSTGGVPVLTTTIMSNITTISSALSSSSGSPTALSADFQVYLLSHTDATIRYASVPNGSTTGEIKVVAMTTTGGSNRIISATGISDFALLSAKGTGITLLWSGTAWVLIGTAIP